MGKSAEQRMVRQRRPRRRNNKYDIEKTAVPTGWTCEGLYAVPCVTRVLEEKASIVPRLNTHGSSKICEIRVHGRGLFVT